MSGRDEHLGSTRVRGTKLSAQPNNCELLMGKPTDLNRW